MDSVVKTAAEQGPEWLYVVASILAVVVAVLGVVVWWLIRKKSTERDEKIKNLETEHKIFLEKMSVITERLESRNRADEVLEKRLASGAAKFEKLDAEHEKFSAGNNDRFEQVSYQLKTVSESVAKTQSFFVDFAREYVRTGQFDRHCDEDREARKELKAEMISLTSRWDEYNRETLGALKKIEGRIDAMSDILAKGHPLIGKNT